MHFESNFQARQSLNKEYAKIKGASAINDVAIGFGKGWIVFAILSTLASAFSFYQDFYKSLGVVITVMMVIILAIVLETFKHLSIKGMFSSMNFISKGIISTIAIALIAVSFYTHFKSIQTFQKNLIGDDLKEEIAYQRDLQTVQNKQISSILASNQELSKALNNGSSSDDTPSVRSVESNNQLIKTLQELSLQNNMTNTNLILEQSRATAQTTSAAILVIFFMVEMMALFSILSKIIIVDNVSGNVKEFVNVMDRLDELEHNAYQSLSSQKVEQTHQRMQKVQEEQERLHQNALNKIAFQNPHTPSVHEEEKQYPRIEEQAKLTQEPSTHQTPNTHQEATQPQENIQDQQNIQNQKRIQAEKTTQAKEHVLNLHQFDQTEQILLKLLWRDGTVAPEEPLTPRKKVLEQAGGLKGKSGVLSNLYAKLLAHSYVEFNRRYKAKVILTSQTL